MKNVEPERALSLPMLPRTPFCSPVSSPVLGLVDPVPDVFQLASVSSEPDALLLRLEHNSYGTEESSEDGFSVGVASTCASFSSLGVIRSRQSSLMDETSSLSVATTASSDSILSPFSDLQFETSDTSLDSLIESSDEEYASEEDTRLPSAESLPDSSYSSRRPPYIPNTDLMNKICITVHSPLVAVNGFGVVVASGHQIKYYESSDEASWALDTRDTMCGSLVSCMEFRWASHDADKGQYLWVGTKEGHLLEVDVGLGIFTSSKMGIHTSQVTGLFRHGTTMTSVDDMGKTIVFNLSSKEGTEVDWTDDVRIVCGVPRVHHVGEKVEFVKLLGGLLWTTVSTDLDDSGAESVPIIHVYDLFSSEGAGHTVKPTHYTGAVTSGTILPAQPDHVYLGHEDGFVSVWNVASDDGTPGCVHVAKVSTFDVLCVEGVHDRLWVGGPKGTISVLDVNSKPWIVTNSWDAHGGLPVSQIFVDTYATTQQGKLVVVSVGRDKQIRFWDGLLGGDRIEQEMLKRENAFSTFRDLNVLIVTWNTDAVTPESLTGDRENICFLHDVLASVESPDVISFGFQEVIDLESRSMACKALLLGGKNKDEEGKFNERVTSSYKRWYDRLVEAVMWVMPVESPYTVVHTESLVGLFTCMFVKDAVKDSVRDPDIATIKRGMGGHYGNKGGIIARLMIDDSSLCFINCHLTAGQHHVRQRNADLTAFLEAPEVFPVDSVDELGCVGGGDGSMVLDHEIVFLNGDMNYRIDQHREDVVSAVDANDLDALIEHDQLHKEMKHNPAFRLRTFREGSLTFAPTYKYDRRSDAFDTSEKQRVPAWCDRVLWRSREEDRVALMKYRRWEANVSDHRPVSAVFRVTVKKVEEKAKERERQVVEEWWNVQERELIINARTFYQTQVL